MNTKHTPGPWEYGEERGLCREIASPNGPECYAIAQTRHGDPEVCEANARLIAAAPDLLEVARSAASIGFHGMPAGEGECKCSRCDLVREARAAIAKATGA